MAETDLIRRQAAIEALGDKPLAWTEGEYELGLQNQWQSDIDALKELPSAQPEQRWIPCSERMPEEDHWLGGSGKQFSEQVLVTIANYDNDDIWVYVANTIDGEWILDLPRYCEVIAWMPLPEPWKGADI